jgi:hypothetical protein
MAQYIVLKAVGSNNVYLSKASVLKFEATCIELGAKKMPLYIKEISV